MLWHPSKVCTCHLLSQRNLAKISIKSAIRKGPTLQTQTCLALALAAAGIAILASSASLEARENKGGTVLDRRSVDSVIDRYGPDVDIKLGYEFKRAGLSYPPQRIALIGLKHEKKVELWSAAQGRWNFVKTYPIQAASGVSGPKLEEGDHQVPEGFYRIEEFNPNSNYHLSMKLNYPNAYDRERARQEGRGRLGGDIFIHGKDRSIGCLAMGDRAIEELFVLVDRVGPANTEVIIAPQDFRNRPFLRSYRYSPTWVPELYEALQTALHDFKKGGPSDNLRTAARP